MIALIAKYPKSDQVDKFIAFIAAAGDLDNDKVKFCYICRDRGYPHEAIQFEKIPGRLCADGTREAAGWQIKNYFDGRKHEHKSTRELQYNND